MKVEHKLSPAVAQYAQTAVQQLGDLRREYLIALGMAKEVELRADSARAALGQQLAIVQQAEGLPQPVAPYQLNAEGTALVGEIADAPAVAPVRNGFEHE